MDYVVGSVAALVSGNVTPSRPKLLRRALTPSKHQPSPDVTPKSETVEDRSIFLSPTLQKKKAIVKKSPKRIFENPDLDITEEDGNKSLTSPKAEKVRKHLKEDLESDDMKNKSVKMQKSNKKHPDNQTPSTSPKKKLANSFQVEAVDDNLQKCNENTPTKKKKQKNTKTNEVASSPTQITANNSLTESQTSSKILKKRKSISISEDTNHPTVTDAISAENGPSPKKKRKNKNKKPNPIEEISPGIKTGEKSTNGPNETPVLNNITENNPPSKKKQKNKKNKSKQTAATASKPPPTADSPTETDTVEPAINSDDDDVPNPNAITNMDTDSEHESDDDLESESEINNQKVLNSNNDQDSSDEEEEPNKQVAKPKKQKQKEPSDQAESEPISVDEVKRTVFIGNVPMSAGVKKKLKKIFSQHGVIQTVRIRSVPVKDAGATPKLAVIKNELHPDRTTVNVYIKYKDEESVKKALSENNTVFESCHLRVTPSDMSAVEHDPSKSIFVGNLPFTIEDEELRAKFERCGEIESLRIVRDRKTNVGKGFGFVNFSSKDGVELALALTDEDLTIKNRILRIKRIGEKPPRINRNQGRPNQPFQNRPGQFQTNRNFQNKPGQNRNFQNRLQGFQNNPGQNRNFQNRSQGVQNKPGQFQKNRSFQNKQPFNQRPGSFNSNQNGTGDEENKKQNQKAAMKRLDNKRKIQENGPSDGAPREKKQKKEFVGITADKKKKRKIDKGQKKKKTLSEILTN